MNHKEHIMVIAAWSLVAIIMAMLLMFGYAVIDSDFETEKVFQIIGPAFQTIVGGFIGLITGIKIGQDTNDKS
jgi:hypothetical protein